MEIGLQKGGKVITEKMGQSEEQKHIFLFMFCMILVFFLNNEFATNESFFGVSKLILSFHCYNSKEN